MNPCGPYKELTLFDQLLCIKCKSKLRYIKSFHPQKKLMVEVILFLAINNVKHNQMEQDLKSRS